MKYIKMVLTCINDHEILLKSLKISIVVGTLLNIINQGDALVASNFDSINQFKILLTYTVPFIVSTYTAVSIKMKFKIGDVAALDANLKCRSCGNIIIIKRDQLVPACNNCQEMTHWKMIS